MSLVLADRGPSYGLWVPDFHGLTEHDLPICENEKFILFFAFFPRCGGTNNLHILVHFTLFSLFTMIDMLLNVDHVGKF